jgi:hypothetical protein
MYKAIFLSPVIPFLDVKGTVSFFVENFDFEILLSSDYNIIKKDAYIIHILNAGRISVKWNFIWKWMI